MMIPGAEVEARDLRTASCGILPRWRGCEYGMGDRPARRRRAMAGAARLWRPVLSAYIGEGMADTLRVQCCIAGGGPAGMMLGLLLGRAGVKTVVLEKHDDFLKLPHSEIRALSAEIGGTSVKIADFARISAPCKFVALMPQWDFLNFLADQGRRFPSLKVMLSAEVTNLTEDAGRVVGVEVRTQDGPLEIRADLVVGCDGRASTVRAASGLVVQDLGSPIDVLWFRLSKKPGDPEQVLGRLGADTMIVTIDRNDYWQCAYVIGKGGIGRVHAEGLEAFKAAVAAGARFLSDRVDELKSFDDIKLLSVSVDRLTTWSRPGLLCIGDAAHAMSPVGGVGINLAIQDAVATANLLAAKLRAGTLQDSDLDTVRQRRLFPVKVIQGLQVAMHNRVLKPAVSGGRVRALTVPWPLKVLEAVPWLRRWPAQFLGVGVRPEHVHSPVSP